MTLQEARRQLEIQTNNLKVIHRRLAEWPAEEHHSLLLQESAIMDDIAQLEANIHLLSAKTG